MVASGTEETTFVLSFEQLNRPLGADEDEE
jgi:hypothetical protein